SSPDSSCAKANAAEIPRRSRKTGLNTTVVIDEVNPVVLLIANPDSVVGCRKTVRLGARAGEHDLDRRHTRAPQIEFGWNTVGAPRLSRGLIATGRPIARSRRSCFRRPPSMLLAILSDDRGMALPVVRPADGEAPATWISRRS